MPLFSACFEQTFSFRKKDDVKCVFYDGTTFYTLFCGELKSYVNRALFPIKIVQRMDLIVVVKSGGMLEVCRVLLGRQSYITLHCRHLA